MAEFFDRIVKLSPKRLALLAAELHAQLEEAEHVKRLPIAIIGMGCRFPGARDLEAFWELLRDGTDPIIEVPASRWDVDAFYDADSEKPGKTSTRFMGCVSDVDQFDAAFFGIAPREAVSMDPQHRLLLEVTWEALEHAGHAAENLVGSPTGVFIGTGHNEYAQLGLRADGIGRIDAYLSTGNTPSAAAGRISYALGLQGPSLAVDTACSSSLVAVHLACQSVRSGECRMAVAGGVNLILSPTSTVALSALHMLAPDGRCKTFDAGANGFVRGEGCGVVVLKRLADAVADGDRVLAVIRGTAVNQDGRSSGLTAPNGPAQQAVIRRALAAAGVAPAAVQYVEAHGTGTALGDPIEVQALGAVLGEGRAATDPVVIGSVKSNIGHLEAAAGVAGLIKVVLALAHGEIPAQLHFRAPNPYIAWGTLPVAVAQTRQPWPAGAPLRLAGVSSFGASGTNAHVVVEEGPRAPSAAVGNARPLSLLTLSAKSAAALHQLTERVHRHLATVDDEASAFAEVCFTAYVGRAHFAHRLAVVAATAAEARAQLEASLQGAAPAGVVRGEAPAAGSSRLARLPIPAREADRAAWAPVLAQWAEAYVCGATLDWPALEAGAVRRKVAFPTYPFQRQRYWIVESDSERSTAGESSGPFVGWQYEIAWLPEERVAKTLSDAAAGNWLIFCDQQSVGAALAERLTQSGQTSALVFRNQTDLTLPDAFQRLLTQHASGAYSRVVYLWGLDAMGAEPRSARSLDTSHTLGCESALRVTQALIQSSWPAQARLWIATRNSQPAGSRSQQLNIEQAPLWGLGKAIAREHPELWGGMIDLGGSSAEDDASALFEEILSKTGEDQVAFRVGQRFVARLVPARNVQPAVASPISEWQRDLSHYRRDGRVGLVCRPVDGGPGSEAPGAHGSNEGLTCGARRAVGTEAGRGRGG